MAAIQTQLDQAVKQELQSFTKIKQLVDQRKVLIAQLLETKPSDTKAIAAIQEAFKAIT